MADWFLGQVLILCWDTKSRSFSEISEGAGVVGLKSSWQNVNLMVHTEQEIIDLK